MGARSLAELKRIIEGESIDGIHLLNSPHDNPICSLSYDENIPCIAVVWRKYATSAQLRFVHEIILNMLTQHAADRILGDDSDLPIVHAEDQRWIVEDWLPRARAAGLKAVATAVSLTFFGKVSIGSIHSKLAKEIAIKDFHNIHSARMWLGGLSPQQLA
ncbi:hypothetical protein [Bradyrhizobium sp. Ai1a-2]|uniref:hypothetical protein n=1 Tax=Bradyrhizobium sp. Ai1a-2 TaxID=196490 RepID=UPI00040676F1|nr:hypothetical protein [Bradyrhizobium sp. Ai1a-2]